MDHFQAASPLGPAEVHEASCPSAIRAVIHRFSKKRVPDVASVEDPVVLARTNAAWEEYLQGEGTLITSSEELNKYLEKI
jgi:hypothetical protein